jgi:predicted transposase YdaD
MQTDRLFHEFFQLAPQALFELLQITPPCPYRFESPVLKAGERRMDGLLEPADPQYERYFLELQGYPDITIYWRSVQEIGMYHQQRPKLNKQRWRAIILFLNPADDPGPETLGSLYHGDMSWLIVGYIPDLLAKVKNPSPVLHVLKPLVVENEAEIEQQAPQWIGDIRQASDLDQATQERLVELLIQFLVQKFSHYSREEIEKMIRLTPIEETVVGKELIQEGMERGMEKGFHAGMVSVLSELIEQNFSIPAVAATVALGPLSTDALKELSRQIGQMETYQDVEAWIAEHSED